MTCVVGSLSFRCTGAHLHTLKTFGLMYVQKMYIQQKCRKIDTLSLLNVRLDAFLCQL